MPKTWVVDLEANGLLEDATKIWCICFKELGQDNWVIWDYNSCQINLLWDKGDKFIFHNGIEYDITLLKKLWNVEIPRENIIDTLVISRGFWPDRPDGHSLEGWAYQLCEEKVQQSQWKVFDPNMVVRCKKDVELTEKLYYTIKDHYIEMEQQFAWLCKDIRDNGIQLDRLLCQKYIAQLEKERAQIDNDHLKSIIPDTKKEIKPLANIRLKSGEYNSHAKRWLDSGQPYEIDYSAGVMRRWVINPSNLNSTTVLRDYLLANGWLPTENPDRWNYKQVKNTFGRMEKARDGNGNYIRTSPKLPKDDVEIESLSEQNDNFKYIADKLKRGHRQHALEGYLTNQRLDGRIPMGINSCGANTMRVKHSVVCNVPRVTSFFGPEMRSVFTVPDDKVMVGCDASGLEARVIAHYLNDTPFSELILHGDVHQFFYDLLKDYVKDRSSAKNIEYAYLYGAGDIKLGSMCNLRTSKHNKSLGQQVRSILDNNIPNMKRLINQLEGAFNRKGSIKALDGREIKCRKKNALLNTLCQSAGAIIMKKSGVIHYEQLRYLPETKLIMFSHDEYEYETLPNLGLQVGQTMVDSIKKSGEFFELNIPLTGEFKIGKNWSEVH